MQNPFQKGNKTFATILSLVPVAFIVSLERKRLKNCLVLLSYTEPHKLCISRMHRMTELAYSNMFDTYTHTHTQSFIASSIELFSPSISIEAPSMSDLADLM